MLLVTVHLYSISISIYARQIADLLLLPSHCDPHTLTRVSSTLYSLMRSYWEIKMASDPWERMECDK